MYNGDHTIIKYKNACAVQHTKAQFYYSKKVGWMLDCLGEQPGTGWNGKAAQKV